MFSRHEEMFRNEFHIVAISPREYRPTMTSLESRDFIDAAYLEGEQARTDRLPQSACPYAASDPSSHNWRRGWMGARLAEVEAPLLAASLQRAGLIASSRAIEQLEAHYRFELADWLDGATDLTTLEIQCPSWVQFEPTGAPDDSITATTAPRHIAFAIPCPLPNPDDEAEGQELPRLREQPPATREESLLQDLLRQFDDLGVQLVEEQWYAFSEQDQDAAIDWLNDRLAGQMSPVPASIFEFATTALRHEATTS